MSSIQQIMTIALIALVTFLTRALPFMLLQNRTLSEKMNQFIQALPYAVAGLLFVYSLKDISLLQGDYGVKEAAALILCFILHRWKHNSLLSIAGSTVFYIILQSI